MIKKILKWIDSQIFNSSLTKIYRRREEDLLLNHKSDFYEHGFTTEYAKNNSELNALCDKYGSDKGEVTSENNPYVWDSHNYADAYELMFRLRKNDVQLLIECGLGSNNPNLISNMGIDGKPGASLRVWRDFFPNAKIIGIDIDSDTLFEEERIKTYQCDQTSPESIQNFCNNSSIQHSSVDIFIDDGLHEYHAGISLFESMNKYLAENGIYIIEDVIQKDYKLYKDYFSEIKDQFSIHIINLHRPNRPVSDNRLFVIRRA
jgi:hypothetical protein